MIDLLLSNVEVFWLFIAWLSFAINEAVILHWIFALFSEIDGFLGLI